MFHHKKCGYPLSLDLSHIIRMISNFGIQRTSLKVNTVEVIIPDGRFSARFFCKNCGELVENSEIFALCMGCGNKFNLEEVFRSTRVSGCYCKDCIKEVKEPSDSTISLQNIINEATF
jgi:hypothetical protein